MFDSSDGKTIVVISSGSGDKTLKINEVSKSSLDTAITIVETDIKPSQINLYIAVKIDEIVGVFYVFERVLFEENK